MPDALCLPHKNRRVEVLATRVIAGTPMCEDCFAGKPIENIASRFSEPSIHVRGDDVELQPAPEPASPWRSDPIRRTPPVNPLEKKNMPSERTDLDWTKIQNERSDGASVDELSKKYHVSAGLVYMRTKRLANGVTHAAPRRKPQPRAAAPHANGDGPYAPAIALLREKRDALDEIIAKLESLG